MVLVGAGGAGVEGTSAEAVLDAVQEGQVGVVQVWVDKDLHDLLLEPLDQVAHDGRKRPLVLAQALTAKAGPKRNVHIRRVPEAIPEKEVKFDPLPDSKFKILGVLLFDIPYSV